MKKNSDTKKKDEQRDDVPPPSKVEQARAEREGKTFQGKGREVKK